MEIEATAVAVGEEAAILGGEVVATEILIVGMGEVLTVEARDTPGHQDDAIHENEAHSEGPQGNQILMSLVAEVDSDETIVQELLPPNLDRHLPPGQTPVLHRVAGSALLQDHARLLLAGDLEHQKDAEIPTEAVEGEEEDEVRIVHPVEDRPLLPDPLARAHQGHPNEEPPRTLLAPLLRPDLDELVETLVPCLGHLQDLRPGHLVGEYLAAERELA